MGNKYTLKQKRERNQKIASYLERGYTQRAVARIFRISESRVSRIKNQLKGA